MHILDDVNYEIAVLRRNITDTYNASTEASARADFVAAAVLLEAADDLQSELRAALDFRAELLGDVPCDTCDGDQCSNCYYDGANNGTRDAMFCIANVRADKSANTHADSGTNGGKMRPWRPLVGFISVLVIGRERVANGAQ